MRTSRIRQWIVFAALVCAFSAGCRKRALPPAPPPPPPPLAAKEAPPAPPPPAIQFAIEPAVVEAGQAATLRWSVINATEVNLDPFGAVQLSGSRQVFERQSRTFTLAAVGPGGQLTRTVALRVVAPQHALPPLPPPPKQTSETPLREPRLFIRDQAKAPPGTRPASDLDRALASLRDGAFRFELPPQLRQDEPAQARLLVDADPLLVVSDEQWAEALRTPGYLPGTRTKISPAMKALLSSGPGLRIHPLFPPSPDQDVLGSRVSEWLWELRPVESGPQTVTLDLQARIAAAGRQRYLSVLPPQVHTRNVAPSSKSSGAAPDGPAPQPAPAATEAKPPKPAPSQPSVALEAHMPDSVVTVAVIIVLLAAGLILTPKGRKILAILIQDSKQQPATAPAATPVLVPTPPPAPGLPKSRVLIVHGRDDHTTAEDFCEGLKLSNCEYVFGLRGFAQGSPEWQKHFLDNLKSVEAVLVLLTYESLAEQWTNWQVVEAIKQQPAQQFPIYPVVLDERVNRAAATLNRLTDMPWFHGTRPRDVEEVKETLAALEPSVLRSLMCFISYSRKDAAPFATRLRASLEANGVACYQDVADLYAGAEWERQLARAIDTATHVLFVITAASVESVHVADEVMYARNRNKVIIPILLEPRDLPFAMQRLQAVSFAGDYDTALATLIDGLTRGGRAAEAAG